MEQIKFVWWITLVNAPSTFTIHNPLEEIFPEYIFHISYSNVPFHEDEESNARKNLAGKNQVTKITNGKLQFNQIK